MVLDPDLPHYGHPKFKWGLIYNVLVVTTRPCWTLCTPQSLCHCFFFFFGRQDPKWELNSIRARRAHMGLMAKDLDELCVFILCQDLVMDRASLESNHRIQSCVSYYRYVSFGSKKYDCFNAVIITSICMIQFCRRRWAADVMSSRQPFSTMGGNSQAGHFTWSIGDVEPILYLLSTQISFYQIISSFTRFLIHFDRSAMAPLIWTSRSKYKFGNEKIYMSL